MKHLLILLLILTSLSCYSQTETKKFSGKILITDQFDHFYEVSDNEIKKYDSKGVLICSYSDNIKGIITNVDVTNPYKVMVFFQDFANIIILDNTLSPTSEEIDLTNFYSGETSLVCKSYNNGFWYFNFIDFELVRLTQGLNPVNSSGNLSNLLNKNIRPNYIVEYNNRLYLNDPKHGILVFDIYGTYLKTIPIYGLNHFQVKEKYIVYINDDELIEIYDFFSLEKQTYQPKKYNQIKLVRIENKHIFLVNKNNELIIDKIEN